MSLFRSKRLALVAALLTAAMPTQAFAKAKNIVLVHGAWVDGSGWKAVYEALP